MDNYVVIRLFLIIFAVVTLGVMVKRYNNLQQYKDSERFHELASHYHQPRAISPTGYYSNHIDEPRDRSHHPSDAPMTALSEGDPKASPGHLPDLPAPEVATPARRQIANETRKVAANQLAPNESSEFMDAFEHSLFHGHDHPKDCYVKDKLTASDLLPKDAVNTKWAKINPKGQGSIKAQNFMQAGYHVGLNTSQGSKRNSNLQFRSEPPAPKLMVSPWLNSEIEPDLLRRPLEVGENC
jgi:hypothetical protein